MIVTTNSQHYTDIADAIRNKLNATDTYKPDEMADAILSISGGGNDPVFIPKKDVNFYDYDGTLLYSYTTTEAQELTALPPLPSQMGLICQGWNYTIEEVNSLTQKCDVGAMYITDDGKTRLYIYIPSSSRADVPLYWTQTISEGVTVNWGDGSFPETFTGTGKISSTHTYSLEGEYIITLEVTNGILGFGHGSGTTTTIGGGIQGYRNYLRKVEIGSSVTSLGVYAFTSNNLVESITIPNGVTKIDNRSLQYLYIISAVVIPNSVTSIGSYAFQSDTALSLIVIPNSVTSIGSVAFQTCRSLTSIVIPGRITLIDNNVFQNCYCLSSVVIPNGVTSIGSNVFESCSLISVIVPSSVSSIGSLTFRSNTFGREYYFLAETPPTLGSTNAFESIPSDCIIYVPSTSLEAYKTATNWTTYADFIYPYN